MFITSTQIRIHYALTDQMGFVYYGNYAQFFEIGRVEALRSTGFTYKEIEAMGIIMPVVDLHCKYMHPVRYDEVITVKTILKELPDNHKFVFYSEVYNQDEKLCTSGVTTLYMMQKDTMQRAQMPDIMRKALEPFFNG